MLYTEVKIDSYSVVVEPDEQEYRFEATCLVEGELPHTHIFVYSIVSPDDPSTDVFARVAVTSDLDNLTLERDDALEAEQTEYLSSFLYKQYPEIDTAIDAKNVLQSRINELTWSWVRYRDAFIVDDGEIGLYPTNQPSLEEERTTAYVDAKNNRIAAETALAAADTEVATAEAALENSNTINTIRIAEDEFSKQTLSYEFNNYHSKITTEGTDAKTYRLTVFGDNLSTHIDEAALNRAVAASDVASKEEALSNAKVDRASAVSILNVAQEEENEALAALLEVLPNFDPDSV